MFTDEGNEEIRAIADDVLFAPRVHPILYPLVMAPLIQLFAYHIADLRGLDVDKLRDFAKSVTVE